MSTVVRARIDEKVKDEAAMGTTQFVVARLEGGGSLPSIKTIRRYAEATGTKPEIRLVQP